MDRERWIGIECQEGERRSGGGGLQVEGPVHLRGAVWRQEGRVEASTQPVVA